MNLDMRPATDAELAELLGQSVPGAAPSAPEGTTLLSAVLDDLALEVAKEPWSAEIRNRPGWTCTYVANLTHARMAQMAAQCPIPGKANETNMGKFAALVLLATNTAIHVNGLLLVGDDGAPVTLRSAQFCTKFKTADKWAAVVKLFGGEADVIAHSNGAVAEWGLDAISS